LKVSLDTEQLETAEIPAALAQLSAAAGELAARLLAASPAAQPEQERLLTVAEAAVRLKLTKGYVYELIKNGNIAVIRAGKHIRIERTALEAFIASSSNGAGIRSHGLPK
jgi:excisionase family DNA binding protein